jgi:Subtilase family/FG-GAP-like repeat
MSVISGKSLGRARVVWLSLLVVSLSIAAAVTPSAASADQVLPNILKRTFAHTNANIDVDGIDDVRVDADVAIFDNGVDLEHPDLNVVRGIDCVKPPNYVCESNSPDDGDAGHSHGTWTALDLAAIDNGIGTVGVAPGARIWAVKVIADGTYEAYVNQQTVTLDLQAILAGLNLVVAARQDSNPANDMEVVVLHWPGCATTENPRINCPGGPTGALSQSIRQAITNAVDAGVVVFSAAGNGNQELDQYGGGYEDTIAVSAIVDTDGLPGSLGPDGAICNAGALTPGGPTTVADDTRNPASGWGTRVDLTAPGACTSTSTPIAAGGGALLASTIDPDSRTDVNTIRNTLQTEGNQNWTDTSSDGVTEPLVDFSSEAVFDPVTVAGPGPGHFANSTGWTFWSSDYSFDVADVNGDGQADAVGRNASGDVQVGLSTGHSFATSTSWTQPWTWSPSYTHRLADVNGDGRADAIGRNSGGDVQVGLSTGTSFANSTGWTFWSSSYSLDLADVNGDNRADIVGRNASGDVRVRLSTGTAFHNSAYWTSWSTDYTLGLFDADGDGRADVIGRNSGGDVQVGLSSD